MIPDWMPFQKGFFRKSREKKTQQIKKDDLIQNIGFSVVKKKGRQKRTSNENPSLEG